MAKGSSQIAADALLSFAFCLHTVLAQKGLGSLNDPCDCMQHHDFWMTSRQNFIDTLSNPEFHKQLFKPSSYSHRWAKIQSCMYSPENEEAHRPTALSDCIPGFLLVHIVCMQHHLVMRRPDRVLEYSAELMRLYPFGAPCLDNSDWPLTSLQVLRYYRRVRRAIAAGPSVDNGELWTDDSLQELAWRGVLEPGKSGESTLVEDPDVCPATMLPGAGVCWLLGEAGGTCEAACQAAGLSFRSAASELEEPIVPKLLLHAGLEGRIGRQHRWAPFECYVPGQGRFHDADLSLRQDPLWKYPICQLACPCSPVLAPPLARALSAVPDLLDV